MGLITRRRAARRQPRIDIHPPRATDSPAEVTSHAGADGPGHGRENRSSHLWELAAAAGTAHELLCAVEERDGHSPARAAAVVALAVAVGRRLGVDEARLADIEWAARLRDVGKLCIPRAILEKPGELTSDEWSEMRQHAEIGERIIGSIPDLAHLARIVRAGHERWDGTGYPDRIRGHEIPLASRIVFVSDAYHAMISDAPYRHVPLTPAAARAELERHAGTQFCPSVAAAALEVLSDPAVESDHLGS
jgi:HD-GYP domain-containing protein (c-di-GMP phosphodiesterase class II)